MKKIFQSRVFILVLGVGLIAVGLFFAVRYIRGTISAYREMQFARQNNFAAGIPDTGLLRPWMNLEYIAVAYAVPQEYIFDELGIPMERRFSRSSLMDLNDQFRFGRTEQEGRPYPLIMDKIRQAIEKYQENPVPTGLKERGVQPWMSVQYIANSIGIPAETIFEQLGLPPDSNSYMLLEGLAEEIRYEGGPRQLSRDIQQIVDTYEAPQ